MITILRQRAGGVTSTAILAPDGSASAPSYSFLTSPNTGIYLANTYDIIFGVAGQARWVIDQGGDIHTLNIGTGSANIARNVGSSTVPVFSFLGDLDTGISRSAANELSIISGSVEALKIKATGAMIGETLGITSGSGTGLTVNEYGLINKNVHKVTVTYAALAAAATTADKVIATLPAKTKLVGIYSDTTIKYIGGAVTAATLIVGKTTGGNEYIVSHDVFAAAITKGLADADLGTSINRASAIQGGDLPSWTATTDISVRLTTTTANTNALTQGSTTYYLVTEIMP